MFQGGPLSPRASASLLIAAGMIDLVLVGLLAVVVATLADGALGPLPEAARLPGVFVALLVLHVFVTEVGLGGLSLGRACLGLRMRDRRGGRVRGAARLRRALEKTICLGVPGLSPAGLAFYNRETVWTSPIAPRKLRPIETWELRILKGGHAGQSVELRTLMKKARGPLVLIGRDKARAHLALPRDGAVSDLHCQMMIRKDGLLLRDGGGDGTPSRNGTWIGDTRLSPGKWHRLGKGQTRFRVGNVTIEIDRT